MPFADFLEVNISNRRNPSHNRLSLLMIDIDFFSQVNDAYGRPAGDKILAALDGRLHSSLRRKDIAAKYGGEEFVVLAPQTGLFQAAIVAEKLRCNVQLHNFGLNRPLTVSIGITIYQCGESGQRLIKRADDAHCILPSRKGTTGFVTCKNNFCLAAGAWRFFIPRLAWPDNC